MAQTASISGKISSNGELIELANVVLVGINKVVVTDTLGKYYIDKLSEGTYTLAITYVGYDKIEKSVFLTEDQQLVVDFELKSNTNNLKDVVITGTLKEVIRLESPVTVEVYTDLL
jgi:outer membrane receptor for ferrienterochelin and colicins